MELFFSNGALAVLEKQFPEKIMLSRECRVLCVYVFVGVCVCVRERQRLFECVRVSVRARAHELLSLTRLTNTRTQRNTKTGRGETVGQLRREQRKEARIVRVDVLWLFSAAT